MQQSSITNLHIARVKGTPSDPVQEATALSGQGLEGDRSCNAANVRQVLFMDKETLDRMELQPGQMVSGCYPNVIGLPLCRLLEMLAELGCSLPPLEIPESAANCRRECPFRPGGES